MGAEPIQVNDAFRSLQSGKIEANDCTDTIADGLRTHLSDQNFPIIQKLVDRIICVEEAGNHFGNEIDLGTDETSGRAFFSSSFGCSLRDKEFSRPESWNNYFWRKCDVKFAF